MKPERIFPDQYVPNEETSSGHLNWAKSNKAEDAKWRLYRDAAIAHTKGAPFPAPPNLATRHGKALVASADLHMSVIDIGSVYTPPPTGNLLDVFTDFHSPTPTGTTIFVNRWENDGNSAMQTLAQSSPPWPSPVNGPGVRAITTPYGDGFHFLCDAQMNVGSGGKKSEIVDNQLCKAGIDQVWRGKCYFPSAGNLSGFPPGFNSWNNLWELHDDIIGTGLQFGVNTDSGFGPVPSIYFRSVSGSWNTHQGTNVLLQYNVWYDWRVEIKLSTGSDGYIRFYWNQVGQADTLVFSRINAPNMVAGQRIPPYLQFGLYGPEQLMNEVYFADMRLS